MIPAELAAYFISLISLAISLFALWELHEARENGNKWIDLCKDLKSRLEQLESKKK